MTRVTKYWFVFLVMLLVGLALAVAPVSAQGPQSLPDKLTIELAFEEDGEWVANATLEGLKLQPVADFNTSIEVGQLQLKELTPASLKAAMDKWLGLEVDIPALSPEEVKLMMDHGVQYLAVRKSLIGDSQEVSLYENGKVLFTLQVSDEAIDAALAQLGLADFSDLITVATNMDEATVILRFPATGKELPVSFEDVVEPASSPPTNLIEAGATVHSTETKTEIVSVAGVTAEELNKALRQMGARPLADLVPLPLTDLNVKQVDVTLGRNGLEVNDHNGRWAKLLWDRESRGAAYEFLPVIDDFVDLELGGLDPSVRSLIENPDVQSSVESWVGDTEIRFSTYVGEEPQESPPKVHIAQPLIAELDEKDNLIVGGVDIGAIQNADLLRSLLPIAAKWDGTRRELRATINGDKPIPYLFFGENALPKIGPLLSKGLPWGETEKILENTDLTAVLAARGETPSSVQLDYAAKSVPSPALRLVPRIVVDREGHIGLGEPPTRISGLLEAVGVPISKTIEPYVKAYAAGANLIGIRVNPNAITFEINAEPVAGIRWDSELRRNLIEAIPDEIIPLPSLPFGLQALIPKDWKSLLVENLVQMEWGSEIAVTEEIPESFWDPLLSRLGQLVGAVSGR